MKNYKPDFYLFILLIIISLCGMAAVYTATYSFDGSISFIQSQSAAFVIGFTVMIVLSALNPLTFRKISKAVFLLSFVLLAAVLVLGTGYEETGSKSWIYIGPVGFQPSEFVKLGFIISFSAHAARCRESINKPLTLLGLILHICAIVIPVCMQPDFGTAFVFIFIAAVILLFSGLSYKYFIAAAVSALAVVPVVWLNLKEYQKNRILVFLNPQLDPSGAGYNVIQSKTALGSGGIFGQGFLKGMLTQSDMLPAKHTDFIFSVIGEEAGLIGCFVILLLLALIIMHLFKLAFKTKNPFESCLCSGIAALLLCHSIINTGMCVGLMPVTGIPLPFISYGGTFMISNMAAAGIAASVHSHLSEYH